MRRNGYGLYLVKAVDTPSGPSKMMKLLPYGNDKHSRKDAQTILCRWIIMNKLGLIEDGEIFDDYYQETSTKEERKTAGEQIDITFPKVMLVARLWKTDLDSYIRKVGRLQNGFTYEANKNIAHLMKEIIPKLKLLHDTGLIHGDIKDGNIVCEYEDSTDRYGDYETKFIEFGFIDFGCSEIQNCWIWWYLWLYGT